MITKEQWKNIRGSSPKPDQIMISIKGDAAHSIAIRWRTDTSVDTAYALYREKGTETWQRIDADKHFFATDMDDSNFFFAYLENLSADTYYEYTCGDDANRSDIYTFKTTKENLTKFSFLCVSDVQAGDAEPPADYTTLGEVLKKALAEHPECDFIITAGDNTNCGQTDIQWTGLFEGLKGIIEETPIQFCMGNHDDMGFSSYFTKEDKYYSEYAEYFTNQLWGSYDHNGPTERPVANYSFDYGNARFSFCGTSGYEEMNQFLLDMANTDKTWKFAAHHFPVCYSGPCIENDDTYPALRDGMDKYDVVFSGHEHSFARSYPRRGEGLYDKPSEGTVHYNLGSSNRNPPGTRVVPKVWNAKTYCHEEDLSMFSIVDVDGDKCTLTAYVEDGRIIDKSTIDKGADLITPYDPAPVYNRTRIKFKGYDLGMCASLTLPQIIDGIVYIPIGQLINFIGGDVERTKGKIKIGVYGKTSEFTENSATVVTQDGEYEMEAPCLRLSEGQLFAPAYGFCKNLRMTPYYYEHNNFITIESNTEARPIPYQP